MKKNPIFLTLLIPSLVIGVVKQESLPVVDPMAYNIATSSDVIVRIIRQALQNDQEILEKFNRSVVE